MESDLEEHFRKRKESRGCSFSKCACGLLLLIGVIGLGLYLIFGIPSIPKYQIESVVPSQNDSNFQLQGNSLNLNPTLSVAISVNNENRFEIDIKELSLKILSKDNVLIGIGNQTTVLGKQKSTAFSIPVELQLSDNLSQNESSSLSSIISSCGYDPIFQKIRPQFIALNSLNANEKDLFRQLSSYLGGNLNPAQQLKLKTQINLVPEARRQQLFRVLTPQQNSNVQTGLARLQKRQVQRNDPLKDIQAYWQDQINSLKPKTKKTIPVKISVDLSVTVIFQYSKHFDNNMNINCPSSAIDAALSNFIKTIPRKINA